MFREQIRLNNYFVLYSGVTDNFPSVNKLPSWKNTKNILSAGGQKLSDFRDFSFRMAESERGKALVKVSILVKFLHLKEIEFL